MSWLDTLLTASSMSPLGLTVFLLITGMIALAVEVLIIPGFGFAGILGGLTLATGIVYAWMQFGPLWGGLAILCTILGATGLVVFAFKSKTFRKRLVLETQLQQGGGTESQDLLAFKGKQGITTTNLRPAGMAEIDNQRIDVVSEGGYIERGTIIEVVEIDGPRVIVAPRT